jgi:hypothetical protein
LTSPKGARRGDARAPQFEVGRRSILRWGGIAAAAAGVAAVTPLDHAEAALSATPTTDVLGSYGEALGGVVVQPRALDRWLYSRSSVRHVVCIGDSITQGTTSGCDYEHGGSGSWVERLATAAGHQIGPTIGMGYRGLWLGVDPNSDKEWRRAGTWTRTTFNQTFDVCPFGEGFYGSGGPTSTLTWTKPTGVTVAGFDLYWFFMPGAGNWQYRVDAGAWTNMGQPLTSPDSKLHSFFVPRPVHSSVQIRAFNGIANCLAPIGGIGIYASDPRTTPGLVVHNLGRDQNFLSNFVRSSAGDPLALLDGVVPAPGTIGTRPDLVVVMFSNDVLFNNAIAWKANLNRFIARVQPYADVLLMSPFEQGDRNADMQAAYRAATRSVAQSAGCALLDLYEAWSDAGDVGYAGASAAGLMNGTLHPSQLGNNDIAARVWRLLRTFS